MRLRTYVLKRTWELFSNIQHREHHNKRSSRKGICDNARENKGYYEWCRIEKKRHSLWTEAANTVTHLENITIRKGTTCTPHYLFYGSNAPYAQHLQVFGKVAIRKEFKDMIRRGVWDVVERSSIPEGRRLIGSKWVYKESEMEDLGQD